ncbi:uncharacterized protein LOC127284936 [Leptopilina boulardi]|uniref:uncharacterized protein LOC127284936 n=1 Tax=Leptopilina boulardi TaxID=63433 RepID=UPI0021F5A629|nr:uncharacterized protein LOC127284936 [Leptopilina boulardi]
MRIIIFFFILYNVFCLTYSYFDIYNFEDNGRPADNTARVEEETFDNIYQAAYKCHRSLEVCLTEADFNHDVQNRCFEMCVTQLSESKFVCNKKTLSDSCHNETSSNSNYYSYNYYNVN